MAMPEFKYRDAHYSGAQFPSTLWSVVRSAASESVPALETLCHAYWPPLYAYVRRKGYQPQDAQDLTQEFFSRLLQDQSLSSVHESKGRFRSFLLASIKHLLANEWKRSARQKRGGGQIHFSIDAQVAEGFGESALQNHLDPEALYEKQWAETLLQRVLDRLQQEWTHRDGAAGFEDLKGFLVEPKGSTSIADAAIRAGATEASLKWAVHKLRERYRELVREEVSQTVEFSNEVDDEIRHLLAALQS
jgi:RNA polymerase sigma-70 factor (ECF subfamily)